MKKEIELSRRTLLASMGAIGAGAALGGAGTMALFNDEEVFEGNQLMAGELDLKVDWQQGYYGPEGFKHISAFPDSNNDDVQDEIKTRDDIASAKFNGAAFDDLEAADQATVESEYREQFADRKEGDAPLIDLQDVKPGDWGEVTFSVHIFDNPAYMWMHGDLMANDENGINEPESHVDDTDDVGELASMAMARVWYDEDGDNVFDTTGEEGGELEVALVSDVSGSMGGDKIAALKTAATGFVDKLSAPDEGAAISFASNSSVDQELTTDYDAIKAAINAYSAGGSTNMAAGIDAAENELLNGTNATAGATKVMILLSDGVPDSQSAAETAANDAKDAGIRIITIALGAGADEEFLKDIASSSDDAFKAPEPEDLDTIYAEIAQVVFVGEQVIAVGTLADVLDKLDDGIALDGNRAEGGRQCYPNSTTQYFGFKWWLPIEVGNEVQSDSVEFDLRFYAEQCRHNDGTVNPFATTTTTEEPTTTTEPV
ncbi:VWA domain-containing protein [Halobacteriaceae archaeon GCM10025711]